MDRGLSWSGLECNEGGREVEERQTLTAKIAWIAFCATCVQSAFLMPYPVLIPGERANLFTALLCAGTLILALVASRTTRADRSFVEVAISILLLALIVVSSLLSETIVCSLSRGITLAASGLGGFWSARLLIRSAERRRQFIWVCTACLAGMLALSLLSLIVNGNAYSLVEWHWHPLTTRIFLLSFAPLCLIGSARKDHKILGAILVGLAYLVVVLNGETTGGESHAFIPILACSLFVVCLNWGRRVRGVILALLFVMALISGNHITRGADHRRLDKASVAYRAENVFFSWKIAKENPFLGIGLLAPRNKILADYEPQYPYVTKEHFVEWTHELRTSENTFLTFLADLGLPFTLIYSVSLFIMFFRLFGITVTSPMGSPSTTPIPPFALLIPLVSALGHLQVVDGLLHPQVDWYFHALLGLIPVTFAGNASKVDWNRLFFRTLGAATAVLTGFLVGVLLAR
jgi:hypothetical protein